jgi:UDP-N-acetylmuramate--alanine ligase
MKHVHLIGIGGSGLSAIARLLLESGYRVSGSDHQNSSLAQSVAAAGAILYLVHQPENVTGADVVVRSSAVPDDNVEVLAARALGIPVLKRADFLGTLLTGKDTIAVAGTHGKTTTTAMVIWILSWLGQEPSFILGSVIPGLDTNARAGKGSAFVIEADEYDYMFLGLSPTLAVITNVEHDHPDCFPTPEAFQTAFREFVDRLVTEGVLLVCGDYPNLAGYALQAESNGNRSYSYGMKNSQNYYLAKGLEPDPSRGGYKFELVMRGRPAVSASLRVPGWHNVQNAVAALAVSDQLGLPLVDCANALAEFRGTERRFEIIGETEGITVVSDYAHHPTEIMATLAAARTRFPDRRIWAVWQPHTYTRTQLMLDSFLESFQDADHVLITEVYPAREAVNPNFSSRQIVAALDHPKAAYADDYTSLIESLVVGLEPGDVMIVLSAGDADQICNQVLERLATEA